MAENDTGLVQDMNPQMGGGPPPFMQMPGQINPMMTAAPPQSGGVLPPTNPVDAAQGAQPQSGIDPATQAAMNQITQTGAQDYAARAATSMGPQQGGPGPEGINALIKQRDQMSGNLSFHPNFTHGGGAGGFFHNLGQALLTLGAATKPGMAMNQIAHSKQREEYAGLSDRIKSAQEQQKITQEPMPSESMLPFRQAGVQIKESEKDIHQQRADTYAKQVESQAADRIVRETQGYQRLGIAQQKQKFTEYIGQLKAELEKRGQDLGVEKAEIAAQTGRSIAAAIQGNSYIKEHPFLYGIAQAIPDLKQYLPDLQAPEGAVTDTTKPGQPIPQGKTSAPSTPRASASGAAPKRPAGVPPHAQWDPKTQRWRATISPGQQP